MSLVAPTVTGFSLFWGTAANNYSMLFRRSALEQQISQALSRQGAREFHRGLKALTGAAAGGTATETYKRVSSPSGLTQSEQFGGSRVIDTVTVINRATTASDETYIEAVQDRIYNAAPSTYPPDLSGNGGGGKAGV